MIVLGWCWQLVEFLVLLHSNFRGYHRPWCVLYAIFQVILRIVVDILLFSHIWVVAHMRATSHRHLTHSADRSNLVDCRTIIMMWMGWVVWSHWSSRFWGLTTVTVSRLWMRSIMIWTMNFTLHRFFLFLKLSMCFYKLVYFWLTDLIKPRFC